MATRPGTHPTSNVNPLAVIGAAVVLLLFVGWLGWHFFGPAGNAGPTAPLTANETWIQQKARESKGEMKSLSPEDQKKLMEIAGGSGPSQLAAQYQMQQAK